MLKYCTIFSLVLLSIIVNPSLNGMDKKKYPISPNKSPRQHKGEKVSISYTRETEIIFHYIIDEQYEKLAECVKWDFEQLKKIQWDETWFDLTMLEMAEKKKNKYPNDMQIKKLCENVVVLKKSVR